MKTTWNQHIVKKNNKALVLQTIIEQAPVSRADVALSLGLNKGTVSSLVNELIHEELVFESGPGESSGGRRPVLLLFNREAAYSIGIDIGVNYLLGLLTDLQGNIIQRAHLDYDDLPCQEIIQLVKEMIRSLLAQAPSSPYGVVGIGIGVPGIVDMEGKVLLAPNLGWKNVQLKTEIEREFQLPVIIDNEANAGAYGEMRFGAGKETDNLVYISAGIGIGVGMILQGSLYRGSNGFSGELGHMVIESNGKECRCGSKGCWELYASEQALLKEARSSALLPSSGKELSLEKLIQFAHAQDQATIQLFDKIGFYLGIGINNILNGLNPQTVIIGNRLALAHQWLGKPIEQVIRSQTLSFHQEHVQLKFSDLSYYSTALGIAAFSAENFLTQDQSSKS
ncbi:ROK family transcriptional regulator [Brevibacillus fulvus]|uniref:Glucokinase-like ROK family protein n=1 Tax=Brevibacillus fulvus TaxID=1125967 RepID=A0A938XRF6_9BACL|nr:ROK family transcriptional regulator [Brevibacillus fulvus]MBM7588457.1 glucokinase-like ROK family protein [Brevibacillus fulvus]